MRPYMFFAVGIFFASLLINGISHAQVNFPRDLRNPTIPRIVPGSLGSSVIQRELLRPMPPPQQTDRLPESERPPLEKEEPSAFEAYLMGESPLTVSTELEQFGYDLFLNPPSTFAPVDLVPVGPDYLLGPGDEVRITLWGKVNDVYPTIIDREGTISLPQLGILHLAGRTFTEARDFLKMEFSRYYKASEVKMNVSMGTLRSMRVFVVGNARRPGSYTVSSFSTLINALFASGGPSKIGTLRDIQIKRAGKTVTHFDLYDFLLHGDKSGDIRLMPEDVIFIPPVGKLAGLAGDVRRPAIYELKGETRLSELILMAGGLNSIASTERVQIQRIEDHQRRIIFEGDLVDIEMDSSRNHVLKDGDLVKIFSVLQTSDWNQYRTVKLIGEFNRPGEYTVKQGERLSSLIERAGGFTDKAYLKGATFTRELVRKIQQERLDESIDRLEKQMLSRSVTSIEAALSAESALQEKSAAEQRVNIIEKMREAKPNGRVTIELSPPDQLKGSPSDILLEDGDTLAVPEIPQQIQVFGAVYNETAFIYNPKATVASYLRLAGGTTQAADEDEIYVLKADGTAISVRENGGFLGMGGLMNATLDPADTIVVPEELDKIAWLREIKDFTQILYQMAIAAGVLIVVF